jgi:hypothetical protein
MPDHRRQRKPGCFMDVRVISALAAAALIGGCAMDYQQLGTYYVAPGKYEYYRCRDLGPEIASWTDREQELTGVMQKASQEASGTFVNAVVYSPELGIARENLRAAREEAQRKNCSPQSLAVKRTVAGKILSVSDPTPPGTTITGAQTGPAASGPQPLPPPAAR